MSSIGLPQQICQGLGLYLHRSIWDVSRGSKTTLNMVFRNFEAMQQEGGGSLHERCASSHHRSPWP